MTGEVGNPPLLCLDNITAMSTALSGSAEIEQNSQKEKGRQFSPSINLLMGAEIDLESDEDSEALSAHDESDE
jgi:hypothetical protein